jgi:ATP-binding cassette subfamily B protein
MYDPTAGQILLDGAPLHAYDLHSLRSRTGAAYQDFARLSLSLRDNIAVGALPSGDEDDAYDGVDARVRRAAAWAGADAVAASLPNGYATELTRRFEGGVELSGGQWQKVALARSMMRDRPLVLVLDEPTYSLDVESERRVFEWFSRVATTENPTGTITVIVSHRFSTVRTADLIAVMREGRVVESGTHAELLARGGAYAEMYRTQAEGYR